jgi:parallel beta-helix repeat protein
MRHRFIAFFPLVLAAALFSRSFPASPKRATGSMRPPKLPAEAVAKVSGKDAAAIRKALEALPSSGGVLRFGPGVYRCDGIELTRSIALRGAGRKTTILRRSSDRPFFTFRGKRSAVSLSDLAFDGRHRPASGLAFYGVDSVRIERVTVENCGTPGFSLGHHGSIDGVYANDVRRAVVNGCSFLNNERDGFLGIPVRYLVVTDSIADGNGRIGFANDVDVSEKNGPLSTLYRNNRIERCGSGGLHTESRPRLPVCEMTADGNVVRLCGDDDWGYSWGIVAGSNTRGILRNNTVDRFGLKGRASDYRDGISVYENGGPVSVTNNRVIQAGRAGILVNNARFPVRLVDNRLTDNRIAGIYLYNSPASVVTGNLVEGAHAEEIVCDASNGTTISGNVIRTQAPIPARSTGVKVRLSRDLVMERNRLEAR